MGVTPRGGSTISTNRRSGSIAVSSSTIGTVIQATLSLLLMVRLDVVASKSSPSDDYIISCYIKYLNLMPINIK